MTKQRNAAGAPWIARRPLDRRTVLRGAGAALALPLLESMSPVGESAPRAPKRFAALFCPNGMLPSAWRPEDEGKSFDLPPTLAPLASLRESVMVLGNLQNRNSFAGEGHYVKTTAWLSGAPVKRTGGRDLQVGTSVDQLLASRIGHRTPLSSLVLGVEPVKNRVDMGYSTVYGANVSWRTPTLPATREIEPRRAFERLVRWSGMRADPSRQAVLDLVHGEAKRLRRSLGGADASKLDEYLDAVNALEKRIEALSPGDGEALDPKGMRKPKGFPDRVQAMLEILLLALRTDSTRIATFMFGNSVSGRNFSFLDGVEGGHHGLSHHENKDVKKRQYARINRWHVEQLGWLLGQMAEIHEGDGTLLDHAIVQFGSGIADGNRHDPKDLPILIGGRGLRDGAATGEHVRQSARTPLCNLYVNVLNAMDPDSGDRAFGDSTGRLAGI